MKKVISMILAVAMVLSVIPMTVVAEEVEFKLGDLNGDGIICLSDRHIMQELFAYQLFDGFGGLYSIQYFENELTWKAALIAEEDQQTNSLSVWSVMYLSLYINVLVKGRIYENWDESEAVRLLGPIPDEVCDCCYRCSECDTMISTVEFEVRRAYTDYDGSVSVFFTDVVQPYKDWCLCNRYKPIIEFECDCYFCLIARASGDVNGDGEVDINDALQTLMYVAGMPSSTLNESDENLQAALITDKAKEEGEPAIGDVLQILMYSAGMPGSLLNG